MMRTPYKQPERDWHALAVEAVIGDLETSAEGLDQAAAATRLASHGPNRLPEPPKPHPLRRFLRHFHNLLIYVLLASAAITLALDHLVDTLVILAVVIANATIGFLQEGKAEKAMSAIRRMLAPRATVLRDGERIGIDGEAVVPGDIVLIEAGDRVPADLRLLVCHGLQVQEAILTGESAPVDKRSARVAVDAALGDRACMAYSGTLVSAGQGRGVAVATGQRTEIGRISGLLDRVETLTTPLVAQMDVFARWLTLFILAIAALILTFGFFVQHHAFAELFMAVVGLSVAAIPEGLPAVLTITLAVGVQAMARRHAIVRRLPAIETLGSVSVICTDKTGTLTRNEMMVAVAATTSSRFKVEGIGYAPSGSIRIVEQYSTDEQARGDPHRTSQTSLEELARAAALCNDAALRLQDGEWMVEGDPMEGALLAFAGKTGLDLPAARTTWARTDTIPFDAKHRFMATLTHDHDGHATILAKGAPERILAMCDRQRSAGGGVEELDINAWHARAESIAADGLRVLAFAVRPVQTEHTVLAFADVENGLTLLGVVGLIDPPRPEAIEAVAQCRAAGIRVKMITGDHAGTAAAIARQIGLEHADNVLTGADLDRLDDPALNATVLGTDVFARTSPEHKLRLVMALQSHGLVVAMTGDGVNDAPALKRADAGIAMGLKGSEVAKEAAELVLANDNFASIAAAVREGRTVYDNMLKVISWTLPTNAGEATTIIFALLLGMTLPVTPAQILWVNTITAVTLGLALAFEPTETNTMLRPPRARSEPLLSGALVWHVVLVSVLFVCGVFGVYQYAIEQGHSVDLARTIAVNTLVVMEIFHLFFIRNIYGTSLTWKAVRGTPMVWGVVAVIVAAQFAFTYLPSMQAVFATESVPLVDGLIVVGIGVALFAVIELEKQLRLHLRGMRGQ